MNFYILLALIFLSGSGIFLLLYKKIKEVISLSEEELIFRVRELPSVSRFLHNEVIIPLSEYWFNVVLPKIYRDFEKLISRFRISILKIEHNLLKLTNYIRGKREVRNDSASEYWKEINGFKNGNDKNNGNKEVSEK